MADDLRFGDFTRGEQLRLAALVARMAKRGAAGPSVDLSDLKARIERIENTARSRKQSK